MALSTAFFPISTGFLRIGAALKGAVPRASKIKNSFRQFEDFVVSGRKRGRKEKGTGAILFGTKLALNISVEMGTVFALVR